MEGSDAVFFVFCFFVFCFFWHNVVRTLESGEIPECDHSDEKLLNIAVQCSFNPLGPIINMHILQISPYISYGIS